MIKSFMALSRDFILSKFSKPIIIGVAGVATAGKDTFFALLKEYLEKEDIPVQRFALADKLKDELDPFLIDSFKISAWTKNPEEKKLIRPLLVAHGGVRRSLSKGQYWTNQVAPQIQEAVKNGIVPVVTDVRYGEYDQDEIFWIKNLGGKIVYVSRYKISNEGQKIFVQPPNEDEKRNDPALRNAAAFIIEWDTAVNPTLENMGEHIENFIKSL